MNKKNKLKITVLGILFYHISFITANATAYATKGQTLTNKIKSEMNFPN